jgi:transposase
MGRAYSTDLRQKIIDTHNQQESSQRQLAKRFRVSLTFIENLLKRYRTDGTVEPRAHGGGRLAKLSPEQEAVLATLVHFQQTCCAIGARGSVGENEQAWNSR